MWDEKEKSRELVEVKSISSFDIERRETDLTDPQYCQYLQYTEQEEKSLVRSIDMHIMTFLCFVNFLSSLDRSNIGNANTAGLSRDLKLSGSQYNLVVSIFYIGYISCQWGVLMWKILPPRIFVPCTIICWGLFSTAMGLIQNSSQAMAVRFFLGAFEACYSPGVYYYLGFFYYRHEAAKRVGLFFICPPLAAAVTGLISYGVTKGVNAEVIRPWRVLFLIEGPPTIIAGIIGFYAIVNSSATARFLTPRQKDIAKARTIKQLGTSERDHRLTLKDFVRTICDPILWFSISIYFCINITVVPLPIILPQVLQGMGYSAISAEAMSVPPYIAAILCMLFVCYLSDKYVQRGVFIAAGALVAAGGYLMSALADDLAGLKYAGIFIAVCALYTIQPLVLQWNGDNQGNDAKKSISYVVLHIFGQCGPIAGIYLFPSSDGPHFKKGLWVSCGIMLMLSVLSLANRLYLRVLNKVLDDKYGPVSEGADQAVESDTNTVYRYIL